MEQLYLIFRRKMGEKDECRTCCYLQRSNKCAHKKGTKYCLYTKLGDAKVRGMWKRYYNSWRPEEGGVSGL